MILQPPTFVQKRELVVGALMQGPPIVTVPDDELVVLLVVPEVVEPVVLLEVVDEVVELVVVLEVVLDVVELVVLEVVLDEVVLLEVVELDVLVLLVDG